MLTSLPDDNSSIESHVLEVKEKARHHNLPQAQFKSILLNSGFISSSNIDLVEEIGLLGRKLEKPYLSFLESEKFANLILGDDFLRVLLTRPNLIRPIKIPGIQIIELDNPKYAFFEIQNTLAKERVLNHFQNSISKYSNISSEASIAGNSVIIESGVTIEPNVTVYERVIVKKGSILRSGSVVGSPGFEYKRASNRVLPVVHDGMTLIGEEVEVGPGSIIGQGFFGRPTILGNQVKTDNLVSIAHGSLIGDRTLVAAGSVIAGSVKTGTDVWIGPGCVISNGLEIGNGAYVVLGSHVFKDVPEGQRVMGSPARPFPKRDSSQQ